MIVRITIQKYIVSSYVSQIPTQLVFFDEGWMFLMIYIKQRSSFSKE